MWLVLCVLGLAAWLLWPDIRQRAIHNLPAPASTLPVLGNTLDMMIYQLPRLHDWLAEQCELFGGKTWRLQVLGAPPLVVVSSTKTFEDVLKTQFKIFDKGPRMNEIMRDALGDAVVAVDGEKWYHQRKVLANMFTTRIFRETIIVCIRKYVGRLCKLLEAHAANSPDKPLDMTKLLNEFTFDTFAEVSLGLETNTMGADEASHPLLRVMDRVMVLTEMRFHQPDWLWRLKRLFQIGQERELTECVDVSNQIVYQVIYDTLRQRNDPAIKAKQNNNQRNVLELFMDHEVDEKSGKGINLDSKFMRDIGFGTLLAGKDTTALTMLWAIIMLSRYPLVEEGIHAELKRKLPQLYSDPEYVPTLEDVDQLVYLEATIRETLRLYPVVPCNAKEANADTTLSDGTFIRKGTRVYIPSYALGRMETVWGPTAKEFRPERWLEVDAELPSTDGALRLRQVSAFQFPAFHAGPRICLGMKYAMVEMKVALARVLSRFRLRTVQHATSFTYDIAMTLHIKQPVEVKVAPVA